jgi:GNAT superfamily N-acetyltransferase
MNLTPERVPIFLRLIRPDDIEERTRRFLQRTNLDDYFIDGAGAAWVEAGPPGLWILSIAGVATPVLVAEARARARALGATRLDLRIEPSGLSEALPSLGFTRRHLRAEFRAPLAELPTGAGSPLEWRAAGIDEAAEALASVALGDPDFDPSEDARASLVSWLADPVLTHDAECVQVSAAGFVMAQVNPATSWSRITYMGLRPEFRGRGLGRWVHRRGFDMMRARGGTLYTGGTVETNRPMMKIFEAHGCRPFRRLEEWRAAL